MIQYLTNSNTKRRSTKNIRNSNRLSENREQQYPLLNTDVLGDIRFIIIVSVDLFRISLTQYYSRIVYIFELHGIIILITAVCCMLYAYVQYFGKLYFRFLRPSAVPSTVCKKFKVPPHLHMHAITFSACIMDPL